MWKKKNSNWDITKNYIDTDYFDRFLDRLKTYAKCSNASVYSVTSTLNDVYNILNYQHAFWIEVTDLWLEDILIIDSVEFKKGELYNISLLFDTTQILGSETLRYYMSSGYIKAANSVLTESDTNMEFFETLYPFVSETIDTEFVPEGTDGSGTNGIYVDVVIDSEIIWYNGTNGINGTDFEHMMIYPDFELSDFMTEYLDSNIDNGYSIRNVFTSEKTFEKLLKNYNIIDLASTPIDNINIYTSVFTDLVIDSVRVVDQQRILLKDQTDSVENGVYLFSNNVLVRDESFDSDSDLYYFSAFIKEGIENKNKEFFLERYHLGKYPTITEPKTFSIGENFAIRNRASYRLLADHVLVSASYHSRKVPLVEFNYSDKILYSGTNGNGYYKVSDTKKSIEFYNINNELITEYISESDFESVTILKNIQQIIYDINEPIYMIKNIDDQESLNVLDPISGVYTHLYDIGGYTKDYKIVTDETVLLLIQQNNIDTIDTVLHSIDFVNNTNIVIDILSTAIQFSFVKTLTDIIIFYISENNICMYWNNNNFLIKEINNLSDSIISEYNILDNTIELTWLTDNKPEYYTIDINELSVMKEWNNGHESISEYVIEQFSKTKIGDWEVLNNELFLKGVQITNSGTNFAEITEIPKISSEPNRYYDGTKDYSEIPNDPINIVKSGSGSGSFTTEFKIKPETLRRDQPVFYMGDESILINIDYISLAFSFHLPPMKYISFYVDSSTGYPYFIVSKGSKSIKVYADKKLTIGTETNVSFTWNYSTNKTTARLYFDGILVGTVIDQKTIVNNIVTNTPIDIRGFEFTKSFIGKSEIKSKPLYQGTISEFRLWNTVLNPSQVITRINKQIKTTDVLYPYLKGYWKMDDFNAYHIESTSSYNGVFYGGLNQDQLLREIGYVKSIQLSDKNLFISETDTDTNNIYKINLYTEEVKKIYSTPILNNIDSIYLDKQTNLFYFLEADIIYAHDNISDNVTPLYNGTSGSGTSGTNNIEDFCVVYDKPYIIRTDKLIYDETGDILYDTNSLDSIHGSKYLYGYKQTDIDSLNIYRSGTDGSINILTDAYQDSTGGNSLLFDLALIGTYPFVSNKTIILSIGSNTDIFTISDDNKSVLKNGTILVGEYTKNLAHIWGVYNSIDIDPNILLIGTKDKNNDVLIWSYNTITSEMLRYMDRNGSCSFFNTESINIDAIIYMSSYDSTQYIVLLNPTEKYIYWFVIERENKVLYDSISWKINIDTNNELFGLEYVSDSKINILSKDNLNNIYISEIVNSSNEYGLFRSALEYDIETKGIVIGESGLLFNDNLTANPTWELIPQNIVIKDDFLDIETVIIESETITGHKITEPTSTSYCVGKNGRFIRTNNGSDWTVLDTNTYSDLVSVSFMTEKIGLAVGSNNTILSTFSGGDSFVPVIIDETVGFRNWNKVLIYKPDNAIIIGSAGTMIHLTRFDQVWKLDKVLNKTYLAELDVQIKKEDLDQNILLTYKKDTQSDNFIQNISDITYIEGSQSQSQSLYQFMFCGENNMIGFLSITTEIGYIVPSIIFLSSSVYNHWSKIVPYIDQANNKKKAFVLSGQTIYSIDADKTLLDTSDDNLYDTSTILFHTDTEELKHIEYWNDNELISIGSRVRSIKHSLFDYTNNKIIEDYSIEEQDLSSYFKPRMLFLDYYMGRKINLHLEQSGYQTPTGYVSKDLISGNCFIFQPGDWIEFNDYGTISDQNNFLAYQDMYYLNRRVLDGGTNTWGKIQLPYNKYNKRIESIDPISYSNKVFKGVYMNGATDINSFDISNSKKTDPSTYSSGLFEESLATKIRLNNSSFVPVINDVIEILVLETDKTQKIVESDKLVLRIDNPIYPIQLTAETINGDLVFKTRSGSVEIRSEYITQRELTVEDIESELINDCLEVVNSILINMCLPPAILSEIDVKLNKTIVQSTDIVREYVGSTQTLTLWKLWNSEMIEDSKSNEIIITNLNWFNGNLFHLEQVFDQNILSDSYSINISDPDNIIFTGRITDATIYYNLESVLELNINSILSSIDIKYSDDVIYGPTYNIESFLSNLDTVFSSGYVFNMPDKTYSINNLIKTSQNEFKEVQIIDNKIYIGNDLTDINEFREGLFVDIVTGSNQMNRVYIEKIESVPYTDYPDKNRYIIYTDSELQKNLLNSGTINIRTRNTLSEISNDLEFTDNIMFPLPNQKSNSVDYYNKTYFTQQKTSSAYASYILNDDNIRNNVSAVLYLDDSNDWNMNVIDWKNDFNFFYRPVDLHDVGTDKVLKKAITIDSSNYLVKGNSLSLVNVDRNRFNYRLVDGLTVKSLEEKFYWILNADIKNAIIGQNESGELLWYSGDWICGIWESGTWYSGTAYDIEWIGGDVYSNTTINNYNLIETVYSEDSSNTKWFKAIWYSGNWYNGTWYGGTWTNGQKFRGDWYSGTWTNGVWLSGHFYGGLWKNGTWLNGTFSEQNSFAIWENGTWLGGDFANGVWKNGVWDQTDIAKSRFGTGASLLHNAIWEYGLWKNGEFYSGLSESNISTNNRNSIWHNGIWKKGKFYGGVWKLGIWENGVFESGYWISESVIKEMRLRDNLVEIEIEFESDHYYKNISTEINYFVILGEPEIVEGQIDSDLDFLGYSMFPKRHVITEILDNRTVVIENLEYSNFPSGYNGTSGSGSLSGSGFVSLDILGHNTPTDMVYDESRYVYVVNSGNNSIDKIDINTDSVTIITGSFTNINKIIYNKYTKDIYLPDSSTDKIKVLDTDTSVVSTITVKQNPFDVVVIDTNQKVYSSNTIDKSLSRINPITYGSTRIGLGISPTDMIVVGKYIYILCPSAKTVLIFDTDTDTIEQTFTLSTTPRFITFDSESNIVYVSYITTGIEYMMLIDTDTKTTIGNYLIGSILNNLKYMGDGYIYGLTDGYIYIIKDGIVLNQINYSISSLNTTSSFVDIEYFERYNSVFVIDNGNDIVTEIKDMILDTNNSVNIGSGSGSNKIIHVNNLDVPTNDFLFVNNTLSDSSTKIYANTWCVCNDYSVKPIIDIDSDTIPFDILGYRSGTYPYIVSEWLNGGFKQGIWQNGWFKNGSFSGGIWLDGVFESGIFG